MGLDGELEHQKGASDSRASETSAVALLEREGLPPPPPCKEKEQKSLFPALSGSSQTPTLSARRSPLVKSSASRTVEVAPAIRQR